MPTDRLKLDKSEFFRCYGFTSEEFERTSLEWGSLEQIYALHAVNVQELQTTSDYITQRLRQVPAVHSLKTRIKRPENLIAKIIRKKLDDPDQKVTSDNYRNVITDLIGIRALHLFKNQWRSIHEFVQGTWDLEETPIAYVRDGDPENLLQSFKERGCKVEKHRFGYRSVHYLIKSQLAKQVQVAELQVRTLFEEGWSEIDHQVRYPRVTDNPHLAEFLTIFNRLAGSADEMGTFIQALSRYLIQQKEKLAEKDAEVKTKEKELKKAISDLKITAKEKEMLKAQVDQLRTFSDTPAAITVQSSDNIFTGFLEPSTIPGGESPFWSSFLVPVDPQEKTCPKCGKVFNDDSALRFYNECPECRTTLIP